MRSLPRTIRPLVLGLALALGFSGLTALPAQAHGQVTAQGVVVTADPADWTPQIQDGQVNAIVQIGTKVVVGGTFTTVRKANTSLNLTRNFIFAFDMNTGNIDPNFVPQLDDAVLALAPGPDGASVYVGGEFGTVNGVTYRHLALLNLADGTPVASFKANADLRIQDIELNNGWLYVSGKFSQIGGLARSGLARLDPTTGAADPNLDLPFTDPLNGTPGVPEFDVSSDGSKLVAIGSFSKVAGLDRLQIAMLDVGVTPAVVDPWQTTDYPVFVSGTTTTWCSASFDTYMRSIKISPDNTYFVAATTGAFRAGRLCDTASRWELNATGPNQHPTWTDWTGGDTTWSVGASGTAIYVGGHFRWWNNPYRGDTAGPGAVAREGIAALDPLTGLPFSWNPGHERGVGSFDMPTTADGVWIGSDTDHTGGEFHQKISFYPINGGTAPPAIAPYTLPGDLYNMATSNGALNRRSYDGTTFGTTTSVPGLSWTNARGAFMLGGKLYYGLSDGSLNVRTFDGANFGPQTAVNLNGLNVQPPTGFNIPGTTTRIPAFTTDIAAMTGMFYSNGRLYYTVSKSGAGNTATNNMLFYRYFNPEDDIVGANLFVADSYPTDPTIQWANVRGMTVASGKLIYALTDGRLYSVGWDGTKPVGTPVMISSATTWQSRGMFVRNQPAPDNTPPTTPGKPSAKSVTASKVDLSWAGSSDVTPPITYRIYRDGSPTPIGQTTTTSFSDTTVAPGSTHTYTVDAVDGANNPSAMSPASDTVTVATVIFSDDYTSGDLSNWTSVTGLTVDSTQGFPTIPSALGNPVGAAAFANEDFALSYPSVCASMNMNATSFGTGSVDLFRLRTAAGGAIVKVFANASGFLIVRSDFAATQQSSNVKLGTGWHNVELCGTVGSSSTWDLYRDGVKIVNAWTADTGTTAVGRLQLGDTGAKTWTINYDHVLVDLQPGEGSTGPDTTPPTTPGAPTGTSQTKDSINVAWSGSFDDSLPITYRVYRDGNPTPIGQTTATNLTDTGLAQGSIHTYTVDAVDSVNNVSSMSPASAPIQVASLIFVDDFSSGDLSQWTSVTRLTIDGTQGSPAAPSALGSPVAQSAFANKDFAISYPSLCTSVNVNATSFGGNSIDLFRLRTATGGAIVKVFANASGILTVRSDFAATQQSSGVALGSGWHNVELCGTVGSSSTWDLYRDGAKIVNAWSANSGTTPIGRIQLGDSGAKTWTINYDHVLVDLQPGEGTTGPDTTPPTTPGAPTGTSPTSDTINLSWSGSSDDSPPITYRIYRDGNPTPIGQTTATTFSDTGLTQGSIHTYTVDAVDAVNNVSAMSPASAPIQVASLIFADDFSSGDLSKWTSVTRLTIDGTQGSPAAPSALGSPVAQSAFANKDFGTGYSTACLSVNVNATSFGGGLGRPVPAADGRGRSYRQGVRQRVRRLVDPLGLRRDPAKLGRRARLGLAHRRALRHGGFFEHVEPLPRWREDRHRLDRRHRDHPDRSHPDRRQRGEDLDDQLR